MPHSRTIYQNLYGSTWSQPLLPLLRWRMTRRFRRQTWFPEPDTLPAVQPNAGQSCAAQGAHLTWIGHATFVGRLGGRVFITDPIWSARCVTFARLRPPGVPLESLPAVDVVTVTHNHYDHLDVPTLRRLAARHSPLFVVPLSVGRLLRRAGLANIVELDWWETHSVGDLRVTLVPANHWSGRGPFDINRTLWGGFVYAASEGTAFHSGDTAYEPLLFQAIARRFPRIDWAMLPIGAYSPEWFLKSQHMNPEEAARAFELLRARHFVASHYGTFRLTDEPMGEPLRRLQAWFSARGRSAQLWAMSIGETRSLSGSDSG